MSTTDNNPAPPPPPPPSNEDDPFDDDDEIFSSIQLDNLNQRQDEDAAAEPPPQKRFKSSNDLVNEPNNNVVPAALSSSDDSDDELLSRIAAAEEEKAHNSRAVQSNVNNQQDDGFPSDDDEQMCKIADAIELSEDFLEYEYEDDGVPVQNRFVTRLGRPHPLLIPYIYEKVLSHVTCSSTLKSARLVCKSWKDALQPSVFNRLTIRNASHIVSRYPYGLAVQEPNPTFMPPTTAPILRRVLIADPCTQIMKDEVTDFFNTHGTNLTYLGFDANLYCKDHWSFLRNVLTKWCDNLEELELLGVTCVDTLISNSEIFKDQNFKLKKLVVKCSVMRQQAHHHYSTVTAAPYNHRYYILDRLSSRLDGGVITRILRNAPQLTEFVFHYNFASLSGYFASLRLFNVNFENLRVLEILGLDNFAVSTADLRLLRRCHMQLVDLKIGPFAAALPAAEIERYLTSVAGSLERLHLTGVRPGMNDNTRLGFVRFQLPEMPLLKVLKIDNLSRIRVGNLHFLYRAPGLEKLEFGCEVVPQRYVTQVYRRINGTFIGDYLRQHPSLKEFSIGGVYAHVVTHHNAAQVFRIVSPGIKRISVVCRGEAITHCMEGYASLMELEDFSITIGGGARASGGFLTFCRDFPQAFPSLRRFTACVPPNFSAFRLSHVDSIKDTIHELTLDGFVIHDDEATALAKAVAEKVNQTLFRNCKVVKPGRITEYGYAGKVSRVLNGVSLTLVNVHVLINEHFRVIQ